MDKVKLFHNVSSLYKMRYKCGKTNIFIKRDDTLDFAFGGNKARLYEYIAQIVRERGTKKIITFGSVYSNHVRVAAAICNVLGIGCDIIVLESRSDKDKQKSMGLLSFHKNVRIIHCATEEAHEFIDSYLTKQNATGLSYCWVPGGGHMPEAAFGYVEAAAEIETQLAQMNVEIDAVFLPCGTGTSQAGLIFGS